MLTTIIAWQTVRFQQRRLFINGTILANIPNDTFYLKFDDYEELKKLSEKISESLPEQQQSNAPELSMWGGVEKWILVALAAL